MLTISVRPCVISDRPEWEKLWRAYLRFYKAELLPEVTDTTWRRLHDPQEPVHALVAEADGKICGLAQFLYHHSTWSSAPFCYLNDLFTVEAVRGKGVGRALIDAVYECAKEAGASRVYWLTHETNEAAQALYDKVASKTGFIQYIRLL